MIIPHQRKAVSVNEVKKTLKISKKQPQNNENEYRNQQNKKKIVKREDDSSQTPITKTLQLDDFFLNLINRQIGLGGFLANHQITPMERGRLIDWIVEVTSVYELNISTLFISVALIDQFTQLFKEKPLSSNDLHLMGLTCLFIASKLNDQKPLDILSINKISYNSFTNNNLWEAEQIILFQTQFNLDQPTIYHFLKLLLQKIESILIQDGNSRQEFLNMSEDCIFLAKLTLFDYQIQSQYSYYEIACGILKYVLCSFPNLSKCKEIIIDSLFLQEIQESILIEITQKCEDININFRRNYPNFKNLFIFDQKKSETSDLTNKENTIQN